MSLFRIILILSGLSIFIDLIGMHLRSRYDFAYFPESVSEYLVYLLIIIFTSSAFSALWCLLGWGIKKIFKWTNKVASCVIVSSWVFIISAAFILQYRINSILGTVINFTQFADGVGGASKMIQDAWNWYYIDIIIISIIVLGVSALSFGLYYRYSRKREFVECQSNTQRVILICLIAFGLSLWSFGPLFKTYKSAKFELKNHTVFGYILSSVVSNYYSENVAIETGENKLDDATKERILLFSNSLNMSFKQRRNVFIILLESTRYDMIDQIVDGQTVMPELRKWMNNGAIRINGAYSTVGFTYYSVAHTFWGGYTEPVQTMIDDFKLLDYHTVVFSSDNMKESGTLASTGCERSADYIIDGIAPSRDVMDKFETYLANYDKSKPIFGYLFFQDPHFPYRTKNPSVLVDREIQRSEVEAKNAPRVWRTYANQIHHVDVSIGRFFNLLQSAQMLDNSLVIIISDHGEEIYDDGYVVGHGSTNNILRESVSHCLSVVYGSRIDIPNEFTHTDLRRFVYENLKTPDHNQSINTYHNDFPLFLYSGQFSMADVIMFQYSDGHRLGYNRFEDKAWLESSVACFENEIIFKEIPDAFKKSINDEVIIPNDLLDSDLRRIPIPVYRTDVQYLIHYWEYLKYTQMKIMKK